MSTQSTTAPARERPAQGGPPRSKKSWRDSDATAATVFAAPSTIGLTVFTVVPIVMSLVMSFYNWPAFGERSLTGTGNFSALLGSPEFRRVVLNTVVFTVLYLPLNLLVSLGLSVWIATMRRGRQALRVIFFVPVVTPIVANVLVWKMIYQPNGLIDGIGQQVGIDMPNFLGDPNWAMIALVTMSVWQGFGYNLLVFSAAIDSIPASLNEAASLDGVGPWQRFRHITLPMISPSMFFATTMTLITTFQVFAQPYLLTGGGPGATTETLVLFIYREGFANFALGMAAAGAWVLFAIILVITALQFLFQKKWVTYDV
ncbi:carbohydrate ABC transporter permease [Kineosporia babensis]|uniref:Sugar ABC transporter permease n=1 Tax=Kineosporia babensis TaxID=499548 RepID=A0A9X1SX84_9ACTN|nr:sugar ABC transporter permease [Kineosporia babensis]MCD5315581.1 sugar ABC transporter permease [Kineosporia babensis]